MLGVARATLLGAAGRYGPAAGSSWAELFTAMSSPQGVAYTFGDSTTLRASRTTGSFGVSAADPIGYVLDVSRGATDAAGPGLHAAATSDTRRPVYGSFDGGASMAAQFNGTAHCLQTVGTLDMTSTDEVHVFAAVRSLADSVGMIAELTNISTNNGSFYIARAGAASRTYTIASRGTAGQFESSTTFPAPDSALLILHAKIGAPILTLNRAGVEIASKTASQGTGNYAADYINIGARNAASPSLYFNSRIANLAIIGGPMTPEQIAVATDLASAGLTFSP